MKGKLSRVDFWKGRKKGVFFRLHEVKEKFYAFGEHSELKLGLTVEFESATSPQSKVDGAEQALNLRLAYSGRAVYLIKADLAQIEQLREEKAFLEKLASAEEVRLHEELALFRRYCKHEKTFLDDEKDSASCVDCGLPLGS